MANIRQRAKVLADLAMFFAEKGRILTLQEYADCADKPVLVSGIRNVFRSYVRAITKLHTAEPGLLAMIEKKKVEAAKPAPAPKPASTPAPKPKAAVKPAPKPAVKEEKDDE